MYSSCVRLLCSASLQACRRCQLLHTSYVNNCADAAYLQACRYRLLQASQSSPLMANRPGITSTRFIIDECFGRFHGYVNFHLDYPIEDGEVPDYMPWMMHYTARFASYMTDDDIKDVIKTLAQRAMRSADEKCLQFDGNYAILFQAKYQPHRVDERGEAVWHPDVVQLARRVVNLGWGGLWALPALWGAKTLRDLTVDTRFPLELRRHMVREATISDFIGFQTTFVDPPPADLIPYITLFESSFPDVNIRCT